MRGGESTDERARSALRRAASDSRFRRTIAFSGLALLVLGVTFAGYLWEGYRSAVATAQSTAVKLTVALDDHASTVFASLDSLLLLTAMRLNDAERHDEANSAAQLRIVKEAVNTLSIAPTLSRYDGSGRVIAHSSWDEPMPPVDHTATRSGLVLILLSRVVRNRSDWGRPTGYLGNS